MAASLAGVLPPRCRRMQGDAGRRVTDSAARHGLDLAAAFTRSLKSGLSPPLQTMTGPSLLQWG